MEFDYCAECLRCIQRGEVFVGASNRFQEKLFFENLQSSLTTYGAKSFRTVSGNRIWLYAVTLINGESRCGEHLQKEYFQRGW